MLNDLLEADGQEPGFAPRGDIQAARVAGRDGLQVEYVYQDADGVLFHVIGVVVSDQASEATYLITFDAPETTFASDKATFERMLASFRIDS